MNTPRKVFGYDLIIDILEKADNGSINRSINRSADLAPPVTSVFYYQKPNQPDLKESNEMKINVVYFAWIVAAALLGFGISAILAGYFRLPRNFYLVPYITLISFFIYRYVHFSGIQVMNLFRQNWYWGVLGGVLLAIFTVRNVLSQPVSAHSNGVTLVFDILWSGVAYGLAD